MEGVRGHHWLYEQVINLIEVILASKVGMRKKLVSIRAGKELGFILVCVRHGVLNRKRGNGDIIFITFTFNNPERSLLDTFIRKLFDFFLFLK